MRRREDGHHLVLEQLRRHDAAILDRVADDGDVERAVDEVRDGIGRGPGLDAHVDPRMALPVALEQRRQPVIARVALGGHTQQAASGAGERPHGILGPADRRQDLVGGLQHALPRRRERHPLAHAEEERRGQPRLDVPQLVAEGGLREVQRRAGACQVSLGGHGLHQAEVPDFDLHRSTSISVHHHDENKAFYS